MSFSFSLSTAKRSFAMLLISLVSVFAIGCGDDQDDFVFTNTNNNGVGNLTFQFAKPQAATVPADTTTLVFEFSATAGGAIIHTDDAPFANTVVLINVPVEARFVTITAYDNDGHPVATINSAVNVVGGVNTVVSLAGANVVPVTFDSITVAPATTNIILGTQDITEQLTITGNFSNGESIVFDAADNAANGDFLSSAPGVASVSDSGLVTGVTVGEATIGVDYTVDGQLRSFAGGVDVTVTSGVAADVLNVSPSTLTVDAGTISGNLSAELSINGGAAQDITGDIDLTYASNNTDFVVDENTGEVEVLNSASVGETAIITATYDDGVNEATDTVTVTEGTPDLLDVAFAEPQGETLELPDGGFQYQLQVVEYYADNTTRAGDPADYDFTSGNETAATVDAAGVVLTATAGGATISVRDPLNPVPALDDFLLTVSNTTIDSTTISPADFTVTSGGDFDNYRLTVEYANGNTEDLTSATNTSIMADYVSGVDVLDTFREGIVSSGNTLGEGEYDVVVALAFQSGGFIADTFNLSVIAP